MSLYELYPRFLVLIYLNHDFITEICANKEIITGPIFALSWYLLNLTNYLGKPETQISAKVIHIVPNTLYLIL